MSAAGVYNGGMEAPLSAALSAGLSGLVQVALFSALPFLVYLATRRKVRGFAAWLGLVGTHPRWLLTGLGLGLLLSAKALFLGALLSAEGTVSGKLLAVQEAHGPSPWIWVALLLTAWLKTGLSEEIFFRGFVARRLVDRLGFAAGNAVQAVIFGAIHIPILFLVDLELGPLTAAAVVLGPTIGGWIMGWLNEKAGGSILPGWCMHAAANTVAYALPLL